MGNLKKEMKNKLLLKISWYIGLVAFVGGWTIFLIWTGGRYIGAWDLENLVILGFFWMGIFFWLSLIGLLILIAYVIINRRNLHLKMLLTGLMILINIPSVLIILPLQGDIESKVFVKLTNHTGIEIIEMQLHGNLKTWNIGSLDNGSSKVVNYDPPYWNNDARLYQKPDTLYMIIKHKDNIDTIGFPTLSMGECKQLVIDKNLKIKSP